MKLKRSPTLDLAEQIAATQQKGRHALSLSTPTFPIDGPPFAARPGWMLLPPARGLPALRSASRQHLFGKWDLPRHECIVTAGAKAGLFSVLRGAVAPGAGVLIIGPFWPSYEDICSAAGLNARPIYTDAHREFALDLPELERIAIDAGASAIVLSNPNNPTGRVYTPTELDQLLEIVERRGLLLIVDESFSDITFDLARWAASKCRDSDQLVIVNSFSKNLHLQGLRVGATLVPPHLAEPTTIVHQTVMSAAPSLSQHVVLDCLTAGYLGPDYRPQRHALQEFIAAQRWRCHQQAGSFYFFPELPDVATFRQMAAALDVFMLTGDAFGVPYGRHVRMCFARPMGELEMILDRLRTAIERSKNA